MPLLFKDTVALETSPTKTAETVSYGATLLVLAGLLLANFANSRHIDIAKTEKSINEFTVVSAFPSLKVESEAETSAIITPDIEKSPLGSVAISAQNERFEVGAAGQFSNTDSPALTLDMLSKNQEPPITDRQQLISKSPFMLQQEAGLPAFIYENTAEIAFRPQTLQAFDFGLAAEEGLSQSMVASTDYAAMPEHSQHEMLHSDLGAAFTSPNANMIEPTVTTEVHEINVSATKTERLLNRPDKIQRPRLPISSRPQPIQLRAVLPPRVQALRP